MGENRNAFCVIRPPGHHAGPSGLLEGGESCGFCIFNNVAAGALYAISEKSQLCHRCAIVDIDVHHGNGTEEIVRRCNDPRRLFFFSVHLFDNDKKKRSGNQFVYKFYPGTGDHDDLALNIVNVPIVPLWKDISTVSMMTSGPVTRTHNTRKKRRTTESGEDSESGTPRDSDNGNEGGHSAPASPVPPSTLGLSPSYLSGRMAYRDAIKRRLLPALRAFNPDLILISMGLDAAKGDVGSARHERGGKERVGIDLEPEDFAWTTRKVCEVADLCCNGRIVSVLEGGYGRSVTSKRSESATTSSSVGSSISSSSTSVAAVNGATMNDLSNGDRFSLDRSLLAHCATKHLQALIDPYGVSEVSSSSSV
jgi:acetoin utilization deacetylase AcuC-like enzyme